MELCAKCGTTFDPEPEGHRSSQALGPLADLGRVFYGVRSEAPLCPRCRRDLEHTGAALLSGRGVNLG
jgi:hypothetical protein